MPFLSVSSKEFSYFQKTMLFRVFIIVSYENPKRIRCGQCCLFRKVEKGWIGITCLHLFKSSWNPETRHFSHQEDVLGKPMYGARWISEERADITNTSIIQVEAVLGHVTMVDEKEDLAFIAMHGDFPFELKFKQYDDVLYGKQDGSADFSVCFTLKSLTGRSSYLPFQEEFCCAQCGRQCVSSCSSCKGARYCNKSCQSKHWPVHRRVCSYKKNNIPV